MKAYGGNLSGLVLLKDVRQEERTEAGNRRGLYQEAQAQTSPRVRQEAGMRDVVGGVRLGSPPGPPWWPTTSQLQPMKAPAALSVIVLTMTFAGQHCFIL